MSLNAGKLVVRAPCAASSRSEYSEPRSSSMEKKKLTVEPRSEELLELVEHLGELRVVEVAVGHVLERRNQRLGLLDVLRAEVGELRHLELRGAAAA